MNKSKAQCRDGNRVDHDGILTTSCGLKQDDEDPPEFPVPEGDRAALKAGIVQVMIQLSNSPNLQVQVGEAIAVMAESDFPLQWGDLVDVG